MWADISDMGDGDTVETSLPTLGSAIDEVRWDYDLAQRPRRSIRGALLNGEPEDELAGWDRGRDESTVSRGG